jgi:hypothetical protein
MPHVEGAITIARPPEEVFDFVADERNEPLYNPEITSVELLTGGPIRRGSRFRAVQQRRRAVAMEIEWTGFDRPRRLASATRLSAMEIDGALTFERVHDGTRMRWSWEIRPRGTLRLLGPLVGRIGDRQERRVWAQLKQVLEEKGTVDGRARSR